MAEEGYKVTLNVYDLSQGLARQLSTTFLGKAIDGIWHTGVVVYGNEYFFGGGIQHTPAGATPYGRPIRVMDLGVTHVPKDVFEMYLEEINHRYTAETYNLLHHNCNNFSSEVAQFLVGSTIPDYILQLPNEVMNSPMGALIMPMIQNLETTLRSGAVPQAPQFNPTTPAQAPWASANTANINLNNISATPVPARETNGKASVDKVKSEEESSAKPQQVANAKSPVKKDATRDSLGNARAKVQDEIAKEFATIMAAGTLRASEAAALATRRVMQRYGQLEGTMSQC